MAGNPPPDFLTTGVTFSLATQRDDHDLRRLLRETPMPGAISLTFQREPNYFHSTHHDSAEHQTLLCKDPQGVLLGMATRTTRATHHHSQSRITGYLSQLRLAHNARGNFHLITRGFRALRDLHDQDAATRTYLTSILESNTRARRFLESGPRDLPTYTPLDRFETSILARKNTAADTHTHVRRAVPGDEPTIAALLTRCNQTFHFSPITTPTTLASYAHLGLTIDRFFIAESNATPVACAACWDQRPLKQVVVHSYSTPLALARPAINLFSSLTGNPPLPPRGGVLPIQYLTHAAALPGHTNAFTPLLSTVNNFCRQQGCSLVAGFASRHPLAPLISTWPRRSLQSILYAVTWPDAIHEAHALRTQTIHPEVALL